MSQTLTAGPRRAIGYLRVSTEEQAHSRAGLDAQRAALQVEAERRGWDLELVVDAGISAKTMNRPALAEAIGRLDSGQADILMASKLDRLSRSAHDFLGLVKDANRRGWSVVCLDLGVDTSTPSGKFHTTVMAGLAEMERDLIGQRTRDALAAKKAAGVRLGRPQTLPVEVVRRVLQERKRGVSWRCLAEKLTAEGVPTARGGATWSVGSVRAVWSSQVADDLRAAATPTTEG